jgi:methionine-gamma-lyase
MKRRGLSTRAIHGSRMPGAPGEPLVQPIVTATTFAFEDAETFGRVMSEEEYGFLYSRLRNPTVEELSRAIASLEGGEAAQCFASGMAAISAALMISLQPGDTLLCANQLYGATYAFAEERLRALGVEVIHLDVTDHAAWERPAKVRYIETMANPGVPVADIEAIAATKGSGLLIVDNTFASPVLCRPLELGADIVCESATKYLNGHHDVTAGILAGGAETVARARAWVIDTGAVLDPFPAYLLRRGLKTLSLRLERHSENALAVAELLEADERVERVYFAGLESYPQRRLVRRQLAAPGGMVAFELAGGRDAGETFMNKLELCRRATSLGGVDTVISHPASTSHRQFTEEQLAMSGVTPGLLRLSVGCEDADDLLADLRSALEQL